MIVIMSDASFEFGSPSERRSTVYLEHIAGFEVNNAGGETTFVTPSDLEKDADASPLVLRRVLDGDYGEVAGLSGEYLLRNLIIPNLPVGFYGDEEGEPVILGTDITVQEPVESDDPLEYARGQRNSVNVVIVPTLGKLAHVSCIRDPRLGGYGVDWLSTDRASVFVSLFGGTLQAEIKYDQATE